MYCTIFLFVPHQPHVNTIATIELVGVLSKTCQTTEATRVVLFGDQISLSHQLVKQQQPRSALTNRLSHDAVWSSTIPLEPFIVVILHHRSSFTIKVYCHHHPHPHLCHAFSCLDVGTSVLCHEGEMYKKATFQLCQCKLCCNL